MKKTTEASATRREAWQGSKWIRPTTRLAIYLRDGLACIYCGDGIEDGATLSLDHVHPQSKGGSDRATNLVTACRTCNSSRGSRPVAEFAVSVAEYRNHDLTADEITRRVRCSTRRRLPRAEAREMIARRGSVQLILNTRSV